jgi:hypothetical protein
LTSFGRGWPVVTLTLWQASREAPPCATAKASRHTRSTSGATSVDRRSTSAGGAP